MRMIAAMALAGAAFFGMTTPSAAQPAYDPQPWLADLNQLRDALAGHYAHLEWAVDERGADLPMVWAMAEQRLKGTRSEAEAREIFDRLLDYFGDGHLKMDWTTTGSAAAGASVASGPSAAPPLAADCSSLGFRPRPDNSAVATRVPGFRPLGGPDDAIFPAGTFIEGEKTIGVVRIQLFSYGIAPALCEAALKARGNSPEAPCDDACRSDVHERVDKMFHAAFVRQVRRLAASKPDLLIVDIAGNGGGTEWAEAAMRVVTAKPIRSLDFGMVRHPHWVKQMDEQDRVLAGFEKDAKGADRAMLREIRARIAVARAELETPCDMTPLWAGQKPSCQMLVRGVGTAGGLLGTGSVQALRGKPWGPVLLHAAAYDFSEGAWDGPLVVLVDQKTASASVQFAGTLQGNKAAIVMGAPTMASGCGFTWGGIETRLSNSGAGVKIPDCARIRPDGTDDNGGVDPDVLVGFKAMEAGHRRVQHFLRRLPEAVEAAERLHGEQSKTIS